MSNLASITTYPAAQVASYPAILAALTADEAQGLSLTPGSTTVVNPATASLVNGGVVAGAADQVMAGGRLLFNPIPVPAAPGTITTNGTAGSTTYTYSIEGLLGKGNTGNGATTSVTTGNATLSGTNSINIPFTMPAGCTSCNIRRTVGGSTQGVIGNVLNTGLPTYTFVDTGLVGDASTATVINSTGVLVAPLQELPTAYPANGAITSFGVGFLTKAGVDVMTIVAPIAGAPSAGGHDGLVVQLIDTGGHAHTVTGPSNCYNGSTHIATFNGTAGSSLTIRAYNGTWYATGTSGVTLS